MRSVHRLLAEGDSRRKGEVRSQYAHIIDMVPTVLDLLGLEPPAAIRGVTQSPLHGVSFAHTLDDPKAETRHHTQYFEMLGHRAIYHDGWRAVCPWPGPSFTEAGKGFGEPISAETLSTLDATGWELYHVDEDFAETTNVAADNRDRLIAMIAHLVRGGGQVPGDADRRQRSRPHGGREAADRVAARSLHVPAEHAIGSELRRAEGAQPPAQHHRRRRDPRGRGRRRAAEPGHRRRRLLLLRQGRQAPLRPQLRRPAAPRGRIRGRRPGRQARAPVRVRAHRQARPRATARAHPAGCSSTSTAPWSATPRPRSRHRSCSTPAR